MSFLGPQPVAHARLQAAGAATSLVGGGLADPHRFQPGHARARREARHTHLAAVDHDAYALDGQAGLGDRGCQHHLSTIGGRGRDGAILLGGRQVAVQRGDIDVLTGTPQRLFDPADLGDAWQKHQRAAPFLSERTAHHRRHIAFEPSGRLAVEVAGLDGKHAPGGVHHRCAAQPRGNGARVERRRHGDDPQVLAQGGLRLAHQGEGEVRLEAALVQLVEDHAADTVQGGIVLQHSQEQAVGHDFDSGTRADLGVQPHAIADRLSDRFTEALRHASCRRPGRQPPRLLHDDLGYAEPRCVEKGERHARRLAGTRRRHQDGSIARLQCGLQAWQGLVDRQRIRGQRVHRRRL